MKQCIEIKHMLSLYLDNELPEKDRKEVVKHLESCDHCKNELNTLKNIIESINEIQDVELPQDYNEKLRNRLIEEKRVIVGEEKTKFNTSQIRLISGIAASVLIFAVGVNSSFIADLLNNSKVAYLNDTQLSMTKQENNNLLTQDKIKKESDLQSVAIMEDSIVPSIENQSFKAQEPVARPEENLNTKVLPKRDVNTPTDSSPSDNVQIASILQNENTPNDIGTDNVKSSDLITAPKTEPVGEEPEIRALANEIEISVNLTVDDISNSVDKVIKFVSDNAGTIQETVTMKPYASSNDARSFEINVTKTSYEELRKVFETLGISQTSQQDINDSEKILIKLDILQNNVKQ